MSDSPHQLYGVEFTEADQARLVGFSCGDEVWSRAVREWILGSDVLDSMKRWGTRVWLFETEDGNVVGFGSLGTTRWKWPPPDGPRTTLTIVPMLGVDQRFQGKPDDPEWRYSRQIMLHLIDEARRIRKDWTGQPDQRPDWLILQVQRDNKRAIGFYEKFGFEFLSSAERPNNHLAMRLWIGE